MTTNNVLAASSRYGSVRCRNLIREKRVEEPGDQGGRADKMEM